MAASGKMSKSAIASTLAEKVEVSEATVGRFCRSIGYDNLKDLKQQLGQDFGAGRIDGAAGQPRIQIIRGFHQRRSGKARRDIDDAVFHLIVLTDKHGKRLVRRQPHEFDMLQHRIGFHAAGAEQGACRACR